MAYSTVEQVAAEFKGITFTDTSSITITEVERFISEADAVIDGRLGQTFVVPISGTISLLIVQNISIWLVAQRVKDIQSLKTGNAPTNQIERENRLDAKAMKMLDDILNEDILLPDATLIKSTGTVSASNVTNNVERIFKRDDVQW